MPNVKQFTSDKILNHLDKVNDWLNGGNPFPVTLEIDLSNNCNHNCPACCSGFASDKSEMGKHTLERVITQASKGGVRGVIFTGGGEPLCSKHIERAVALAHDSSMSVGLITNGSLLHKKNIKLLTDCCDWIRISLDAGCERMHRYTHGVKDEFNIILENIKTLALHAKGKNCTIGTAYLTGKYTSNMSDMKAFITASDKCGIDYCQFRPYLSSGKKDLSSFTKIDFENLRQWAKSRGVLLDVLYSKHKYENMASGIAKTKNYDVCYGHQFASVICANGDMTVCCHTRGISRMTIGNVLTSSLNEIWNSKTRKRITNTIDVKNCPDLCRCNTFNEILYNIKRPKKHVNFL
jgi:MoaA/NifB/PqqE/SkfB family radical SAM enzyme